MIGQVDLVHLHLASSHSLDSLPLFSGLCNWRCNIWPRDWTDLAGCCTAASATRDAPAAISWGRRECSHAKLCSKTVPCCCNSWLAGCINKAAMVISSPPASQIPRLFFRKLRCQIAERRNCLRSHICVCSVPRHCFTKLPNAPLCND